MPPHRTPTRIEFAVSRLFRYRWFREMVVSRATAPLDHPCSPTLPGEKNDGRKAWVARTRNASLYVADLDRSRDYYERLVGLKPLKTGPVLPHPHHPDRSIQVLAMGFGPTPDLFLVRQTGPDGRVIPVTDNGLSHVAFWIESSTFINDFAAELRRKGFTLSYGPVKHYDGPDGDGGWGGNRSVYLNDPDGHFIELSNEMDPFGLQYRIRPLMAK
jgi:catechol 2,3-dioxygenase-like lactoylglutathione lyase family enzyme